MSSIELREADFFVMKEDYSRYTSDDGTLLKVKIVVKKIFMSPIMTPEGYPTETFFSSDNIVTSIVPQNLKRNPSQQPYNPLVDKGTEVQFKEQTINDQEYLTDNGFRIVVKPVLTKVFRYDKYDSFGYPIYSVAVQQITHVDKMQSSNN